MEKNDTLRTWVGLPKKHNLTQMGLQYRVHTCRTPYCEEGLGVFMIWGEEEVIFVRYTN